MKTTKANYLEKIEKLSINEFEKIYNIESEVIEFMYDYNLFIDIVDVLKYDDNNYIKESINDNDFECVQDLIKESIGCVLNDPQIDDLMHDNADNKTDIYYHDLIKWLKEYNESIEYMDQVAYDGLIDFNNYDFYNHIQTAQYEFYYITFFEYWNSHIHELVDELTEYITDILIG